MEKWDKRFLDLAKLVADWSKDPSTKVGAVLVDDSRIVVGLGYNGFPRGVIDSEDRLSTREEKYKFTVHAEVNALLAAGNKAKGATLYVYCPGFGSPCICHECCKAAIQAEVKEIVGMDDKTKDIGQRWSDSIRVAKAMCDEAGVSYRNV